MLKYRNFGRKSLNEIKEIISEMGLGLGMTPEAISALREPGQEPGLILPRTLTIKEGN